MWPPVPLRLDVSSCQRHQWPAGLSPAKHAPRLRSPSQGRQPGFERPKWQVTASLARTCLPCEGARLCARVISSPHQREKRLPRRGASTIPYLPATGEQEPRWNGRLDHSGICASIKRLSWLSSIVSPFHDLATAAAPQGWRCAPPPAAASALTRRGRCQPGF